MMKNMATGRVGPVVVFFVFAVLSGVSSQRSISSSATLADSINDPDVNNNDEEQWNNVNSIMQLDAVFSRAGGVDGGDVTERLAAYGFNFSSADIAQVVGVTVAYTRRCSGGGTCRDGDVELIIAGEIIPTTNLCAVEDCTTGEHSWPTNTLGVSTLGGPTSLWNTTLTPAQIASPLFGVSVRGRRDGQGGSRDFDVDWVNMTIYYLAPNDPGLQNEESEDTPGGNGGAIAAGILIPLLIIALIIGGIVAFVWIKRNRPDLIEQAKSANVSKKLSAVLAPSRPVHSGDASVDQEEGDAPLAHSYSPPPSHDQSFGHSVESTPPTMRSALPAIANYQNSGNTFGANVVYGVALQHVRKEGDIPVVVAQCIGALEQRGLHEEGLLRLAGSNGEINQLKDAYNSGQNPDLRGFADVNSIGGALKLYFRELPQKPLLMTAGIKQASLSEDYETIAQIMRSELENIPEVNYKTLKRLFQFLNLLASYSNQNRMTPDNLTIVFQPTLQIPKSVLTCMITHFSQIFVR